MTQKTNILDNYTLTTSNSDLRLITIPDFESSYVYINLIGRVGRRAENNNEVGAAHFLEHLFFDGTTSRSSAYEINKFIEGVGGIKNGITSTEIVEYFAKVLPEYGELGFEYLSDIFLNSLLRNEDIEKEKKVIRQESLMKRDDPDALLYRTRLSNMYPKQTIGRTIFDEELNLKNIDRETLISYKDRVYNNENFVICVSGNISNEIATDLTNKYFSKFPKGRKSIFDVPSFSNERKIIHTQKNLKQAKLSIAFEGCESHTKEFVLLRLLNIILGSGFSSRLYERLRSKLHLVYSINCSRESFSDTGFTHITTFLDQDKISQTINEIKSETEIFLKHGINDDELLRAKNICLSNILFNMDTASRRAYYYGEQIVLDRPMLNLSDHINLVKNATKEDIQNIAHKVFTQKPIINIISSADPKISW